MGPETGTAHELRAEGTVKWHGSGDHLDRWPGEGPRRLGEVLENHGKVDKM